MELESFHTIRRALDYYDNVYDSVKKENEKKPHYIRFPTEDNIKIVTLYDKNKKLIKKYKYELIAIDSTKLNTWIWGWSIPNISLENNLSRKLLEYGLSLKEPCDIAIKTHLINSRFRITHRIQIDVLLAISYYLGKVKFPFKYSITVDYPNYTSDGYISLDAKGETVNYHLALFDYEKQ